MVPGMYTHATMSGLIARRASQSTTRSAKFVDLAVLRHFDGAAGDLLVLVLALPISVEQIAQRSHRADEHDERKPEHDAPEAPALLLFLLGIGILCGSHEASPFDIDLST